MKQHPVEDEGPSGVRTWINRHPVVSTTLVALAVLACVAVRFWPDPRPQAFYTVDDGTTWFSHDYVVPPFDYQGKQAVQAMMYTCDGGKTTFIGYLIRYTPEGKVQMEQKLKTLTQRQRRGGVQAPPGSVEVKRPREARWTPQITPQEMGKRMAAAIRRGEGPESVQKLQRTYGEIVDVKCPDGKGMPVPVGAN